MIDALIARGGAVPFRDYMELALYDPEHGYYAGPTQRYGRSGDYLTAPSASRWYPETLAHLLTALAGTCERPLVMVDVGSGDGSLVAGVLSTSSPEVVERCWSVERGGGMRQLQRQRIDDVRLQVVSKLDDLPAITSPTVVHASELYDAAPVHRVVQRGTLQELWVAEGGATLQWQERAAAEHLADYLQRHNVELADGQIAEINPTAESDHRRLLQHLGDDAAVLVLDYGYTASRLYNPRGRRSGSLACYAGHRLHRDPLAAPGEHDITAHVNFDDLRRGAADNVAEVALLPLAELLVRAGLAEVLAAHGLDESAELNAATVTARQEVKRLLDPDGMGSDLKMLIQARGRLRTAMVGALGL